MVMEPSEVPVQNPAEVRATQQHRLRVLRTVFVVLGVMMLASMAAVKIAPPAGLKNAARVTGKSLRPAAAKDPMNQFQPGLPPPFAPKPLGSTQPQARPPMVSRTPASMPFGAQLPRARGGVAPFAQAAVTEVVDVTEVEPFSGEPDWETSENPTPSDTDPNDPVIDNLNRPGSYEDALYKCGPSVAKWKTWRSPSGAGSVKEMQSKGSDLTQAAFKNMQGGFAAALAGANTNEARLYWGYHVARSTFFSTQAILGVAASRLRRPTEGDMGEGMLSGASVPTLAVSFTQIFSEALETYQQDYDNIKDGKYKLPWDMDMGPLHRQANPAYVIDKGLRFARESAATLARSASAKPEDRTIWLSFSDNDKLQYPEYYRNNFHYQTDGWMSENSAKVYETSTETLFLGRQDAMQRGALLPIHSWMQDTKQNIDGSGVKLLEVAAGTGRFNTFIRDNYPLADVVISDLSPYYLSEARNNNDYWQRARRGEKPFHKPTFLQLNAEDLSHFKDGELDVVVCVYLFHEIPHSARKNAVNEFARVVKPGGLVVFVDSVQLGDRPLVDANLANFENLNEPHYPSYIEEDIGALFQDAGMTRDEKHVSSVSKTLSFRKPRSGGDEQSDKEAASTPIEEVAESAPMSAAASTPMAAEPSSTAMEQEAASTMGAAASTPVAAEPSSAATETSSFEEQSEPLAANVASEDFPDRNNDDLVA